MKSIVNLLLIGALLVVAALTPGCGVLSPKPTVTYSGQVFHSFHSTHAATRAAYLAFLVREADGRVSQADARDVDLAWNTYRAAYVVALDAVAGNENAFTPENVRALANNVLELIASAP